MYRYIRSTAYVQAVTLLLTFLVSAADLSPPIECCSGGSENGPACSRGPIAWPLFLLISDRPPGRGDGD